MEHIPYFDAHCDTIYRCLRTGAQLRENDGHLDLHRASSFGRFAQVFARRSFPGAAPWSGRAACFTGGFYRRWSRTGTSSSPAAPAQRWTVLRQTGKWRRFSP